MKVSVITCTYNRPDFLMQAVRSFLDQDYPDKEMIIVNDGGSDVPDFGNQDVHVFRNPVNIGQAKTLNHAIELSRGDLLCQLDDDDLLNGKNSLSLRAKEFDDPEIDVVWTEMQDVNVMGRPSTFHPLTVNPGDIWRSDTIGICTLMYRRTVKDKIGGYFFDPSMPTNEDWDFKIRVLTECHGKALPFVSYLHRVHGGMKSAKDRRDGIMQSSQGEMFERLNKRYKK